MLGVSKLLIIYEEWDREFEKYRLDRMFLKKHVMNKTLKSFVS